jgi:hypothetical protein
MYECLLTAHAKWPPNKHHNAGIQLLRARKLRCQTEAGCLPSCFTFRETMFKSRKISLFATTKCYCVMCSSGICFGSIVYQADNFIHNINTRQHENLHVSSVRLSSVQKGAHYTSIRIYNNLPHNMHILKDNVTRLVTVDGYWIDNWIYYNRTLKYNTTVSLRTPSVLQFTTEYITTIPQPS